MNLLRSLWYRLNYTDALVDRRRRVLLDWSAKAGCTVAIKMFLRHVGVLEEAERYAPWIHEYRVRVYYARHGLATRRDLVDANLVKIKVVRNPYDRAISSYIHAMKYRLAEIFAAAGDASSDLSFRTFLELLARMDLARCNPHYRTQARPYEEDGVRFDAIVHLERLVEDLAALERRHGIALDPTGLTSGHHIQKASRVMPAAADAPWSALAESIPAYASFYDADTLRRVERLYRPDFEHYGYALGFGSGAIGDGLRVDAAHQRVRPPAVRSLSYRISDLVRHACRPLRP